MKYNAYIKTYIWTILISLIKTNKFSHFEALIFQYKSDMPRKLKCFEHFCYLESAERYTLSGTHLTL